MADANSALVSVKTSLERLQQDEAEADEQLQALNTNIAELPSLAEAETLRNDASSQLQRARASLQETEGQRHRLSVQSQERNRRIEQITRDIAAWSARKESAASRIAELTERAAYIAQQIAELASKPAELQAQRNGLAEQISQSEQQLRGASDELATVETAERAASSELKTAEQQLHASETERVRFESSEGLAEHQWHELSERAGTALGCNLEDIAATLELTDSEQNQEIESQQRKLDRLQKERETMGPVNLRAELEEAELQTQIDTLTRERDELVEAINKLRGGIGHLNREARERLTAAFEVVNKHFQELFTRLFNGGHAELQLVGANGKDTDILEAGLEIIASPPGKKLQNMTLMSGGEQALTALSLIFAMFRANPAPICVLDEVDAPLDDANVDRFCTLLDAMAEEQKTRFIVITHHRLTMARMHRLYGVTMMEPGVSKLVSVDLDRAAELVEKIAA